VRVESHDGAFLAWAGFSPSSKIRARAWSFDETQRIDAAFLASAVRRAVKARGLFDLQSDGVRLVHGESDGLPGLIVDRYGDTLVAQFLFGGRGALESRAGRRAAAATGPAKLYERSDASARERSRACRSRAGCAARARPKSRSASTAGSSRSTSPTGHKTGFYLDQRDSRQRFAEHAQHRPCGAC
jgi:23S rRNA (cytosine1962-C5)-methyltransferase